MRYENTMRRMSKGTRHDGKEANRAFVFYTREFKEHCESTRIASTLTI